MEHSFAKVKIVPLNDAGGGNIGVTKRRRPTIYKNPYYLRSAKEYLPQKPTKISSERLKGERASDKCIIKPVASGKTKINKRVIKQVGNDDSERHATKPVVISKKTINKHPIKPDASNKLKKKKIKLLPL